jgi:hypothetical protein
MPATLDWLLPRMSEFVAEAKRTREVIITHDLDYGAVLAFSGKDAPSVIIVRMANTRPDRLLSRLTAVLASWPMWKTRWLREPLWCWKTPRPGSGGYQSSNGYGRRGSRTHYGPAACREIRRWQQ